MTSQPKASNFPARQVALHHKKSVKKKSYVEMTSNLSEKVEKSQEMCQKSQATADCEGKVHGVLATVGVVHWVDAGSDDLVRVYLQGVREAGQR